MIKSPLTVSDYGSAISAPRRKEVSPVGNAAAQIGRIPGGIAQGALKTLAAPAILAEAMDSMRTQELDAGKYNAEASAIRDSGIHYTQAQLMNALDAGEITPAQYKNTINEWRAGGNPLDQARENNMIARKAEMPVTNWVRGANASIQKVTDSIIPAPATDAAEFVAKGADALGEAVPATALAIATGGASIGSVMAGTTLSHAAGAANAFSTEMLEGSGDLGRAAVAGGTEWAAEAIGGKLFNSAAEKIPNKLLSGIADALGEGAEEVVGGSAQAVLTGESYSLGQSAEEFALGTAIGAAMSGSVSGVNAVKSEIGTIKTASDIRAGKGGGSIEGLAKSLEIAQANPEKYSDIARVLSKPAKESTFSASDLRAYIESAVEASGTSPVRVPKNIDNISASNVGAYETQTKSGLKRAASVLEAAQVGKGLSPRQSGNILRAVLETNTSLYNRLGQVEGQGSAAPATVQIERGADYRNALPSSGSADNYGVLEFSGRAARTGESDRAVNVFRGMSSEWVIPTLEAGEFVVPSSPADIETGEKALFGSAPGQMLGAGLYLTSVPSKADQYTSGVKNEISIKGRDTSGIMAYSPIIGATTFINDAALTAAEQGGGGDTVKTARAGQGREADLASFINESRGLGASEAAVIYSKMGDDYTEVVRPDATKTQIERLYMPLNAMAGESSASAQSTPAANQGVTPGGQTNMTAAELGRARAESAGEEAVYTLGNEDVNTLLAQNIGEPIADEYAKPVSEGVSEALAEAMSNGLADAMESRASPKDGAPVEMRAAPESGASAQIVELPVKTSENAREGDVESTAFAVEKASGVSETSISAEKSSNVIEAEKNFSQSLISEKAPSVTEPNTPTEMTPGEKERPAGKETPEERSARIWTPLVSEVNMLKRRERDTPRHDPSLVKGPGSQGEIYETEGYKTAFGGLTSY